MNRYEQQAKENETPGDRIPDTDKLLQIQKLRTLAQSFAAGYRRIEVENETISPSHKHVYVKLTFRYNYADFSEPRKKNLIEAMIAASDSFSVNTDGERVWFFFLVENVWIPRPVQTNVVKQTYAVTYRVKGSAFEVTTAVQAESEDAALLQLPKDATLVKIEKEPSA